MNYDFTIVGQGLAGSLLAFRLIQSGHRVLVIDDDHRSSSSKVAAGLYNPVIFKFLTMGWKVAELLEKADSTYKALEQETGNSFYKEITIRKIFSSENEKETWEHKAVRDPYRNFISPTGGEQESIAGIVHPLGYGEVHTARRLEMSNFLSAMKTWILAHGELLVESHHPSEIKSNEKNIEIPTSRGIITTNHLIYCEGWKVTQNPWFSWLPVNPVKGDVLKIQSDISFDGALNKGCFLLHDQSNIYFAGSTFFWRYQTEGPEEDGRADITGRLDKMLASPYSIIQHVAGIRPTVPDRRPIIGTHPAHTRMHLLNGLGSKGVTLVPHCVSAMADYLLKGQAIDPEMSISRFV